MTIGFIGGGNMARCIIGGLLANGYKAQQLRASSRSLSSVQALAADFGIHTQQDNASLCEGLNLLVLAVKPQQMQAVCLELRTVLAPTTLVISVAAGITLASLSQWLGGHSLLARAMPNTPALIRQGATGLYAAPSLNASQRQLAQQVLESTGLVVWVEDEALMDTVTAVSGSGPAYFFLFMEAMMAEAQAQGLSAEAARQLTLQTCLGAAALAQHTGEDIGQLRQRVTSPKGTTEQAVLAFERLNLKATVASAMQACQQRARELALELA